MALGVPFVVVRYFVAWRDPNQNEGIEAASPPERTTASVSLSGTRLAIICRDHGPFPQAPTDHLAKKGCPDRGGNKPLNTETFVEKAIALHGDRYDYSLVEYVNNSTNVAIICPNHGSFPQSPANHLFEKR